MKVNYQKMYIAVGVAMVLTGMAVQASPIDDRIEAAAKNSYVYKTYLKDEAITTVAKDGVVTLSGTVAEFSHIALARETVASLPGVQRVDNQLVFNGKQPEENSDGWLSMKVKGALLFNRYVSAVKTQVYVTNGIATLKGEAESQAQKDLTEAYTKDVAGIKDVKNEMTIAAVNTVQPTLSDKIDDASITAQVRMAFLAHHSTSAFKTGVSTTDGVVTLTGEATNGAGKDMATKVANDVNGVSQVINNMTVLDALTKN